MRFMIDAIDKSYIILEMVMTNYMLLKKLGGSYVIGC